MDESTINDKRSEHKDVPRTVGPGGRAVGSVGLLQLLAFTFSITLNPGCFSTTPEIQVRTQTGSKSEAKDNNPTETLCNKA